LNGTFERIEGVLFVVHRVSECFVVIVPADFAGANHGIAPCDMALKPQGLCRAFNNSSTTASCGDCDNECASAAHE
jgi:hypothetical protein